MTTVLILIDVQNAILAGQVKPDRQPEIDRALDETVERLAVLKRAARLADVPVVLVQHEDPSGEPLARDGIGWQVRAEIAAETGDFVVHKQSCDAFFDTGLLELLQQLATTRLVIGGCMTPYCIDTTTRRAVSLGYDVTLISDGHMTADMGRLGFRDIIAHHNLVLDGFSAGARQVRVQPAAEIAF